MFTAVEELPALSATAAVVFANELLDNLAFGIAEWDGARWLEVRVGHRDDDGFFEVPVPLDAPFDGGFAPGATIPPGARLPIPRGMQEWWYGCEAAVRHGFVLIVDYAAPVAEFVARPWLRTYRAHAAGSDPLDGPGEQDITADVALEQLDAVAPFVRLHTDRQSTWLDALGIADLVEEGRRIWAAGAATGDLEALAGRSRVGEAAALTDPAGLGAHRVVLFGAGGAGRGFSW